MTIKAILSLNFHSMTLNWSIFTSSADRRLYNGYISYLEAVPKGNIKTKSDQQTSLQTREEKHNLIATKFHINNGSSYTSPPEILDACNIDMSIDRLISWIRENNQIDIISLGHRIIHGDQACGSSAIVDNNLITRLNNLPFLGDIEIKTQLYIMEYMHKKYDNYIQVACFDHGFYLKMANIYNTLPLPKDLANEILPYGLHGLACEQILNKMAYITDIADHNIIIVNLDKNCSSVCAVKNKMPIAASKVLSRIDAMIGIHNAGHIGAGIALYMLKYKQYSVEEIYDILCHKSGITAIAGIDFDTDLSILEEENLDRQTALALDILCNAVASQISALIPSIINLDAIIFSSYIGENSPVIRKKICDKIALFGLEVNDAANKNGFQSIAKKTSKVKIFTLPSNEEEMIALHTSKILIDKNRLLSKLSFDEEVLGA